MKLAVTGLESVKPAKPRVLLFGANIAAFCHACGEELRLEFTPYFEGRVHLPDVFRLAVQGHHARGPCRP